MTPAFWTLTRCLVCLCTLTLVACSDQQTDPTVLAPSFHRESGEREAPQFSAWSAPVNLGPLVNTTLAENEPLVSADGLSLYFGCTGCPGGVGGADIWVSQRASPGDAWGPPTNLGPAINTASDEFPSAISLDGHSLYMNSNRPGGVGGFDLYVARRHNKRDAFGWRAPVNLGSGVNTTANDVQAVPLEDEESGTTTVYFHSDRLGGTGATDIYASTLRADDTFGPAVLIAELSTPSTDIQPAIRRDGLEMFLASSRPGTLGGLDVWVSTRARTSDPWSAPVNLGPVVNSTASDGAPALSADGTGLYFSSARPGGAGGTDLYLSARRKLHRTVLVNPKGGGIGIARTIQEGIAMVAPGGRVQVRPGTYNEVLVIDKGLTLEGVGRGHDGDDDGHAGGGSHGNGTVIVAPAGTPAIAVQVATPEPVTIRGLTVHFSGAAGIRGDGIVDLTVERASVIAINPPLGTTLLVSVFNNPPTTGRARLVVRESDLDGSTAFANSATPPFPQTFGIGTRGVVDAVIEGNTIRRAGGACINIQTELSGEVNADILNNDLDECYPSGRAGALTVGPRGTLPAPLVDFTATGTVNVVGNTIRNTLGSCLTTAGINYEAFSGRIEHNRVLGVVQSCATATTRVLPAGIWVGSFRGATPANVTVRYNEIVGNAQAGLRIAPNITTPIDARCNYWGSTSGPSGTGLGGTGDALVVEPGGARPAWAPFATRPAARHRSHGHHDDDDDDDHHGRAKCKLEFSASLSAAEEVPNSGSTATGDAIFLTADGDSVRFRLRVANIQNVLQAHIHVAATGVNGPVVVFLYPAAPPAVLIPGPFDGTLGEGTFTAANLRGPLTGMQVSDLLAQMLAGNTYANVHTSQFTGGEIRGQIHQKGR